MNYLIILAAGLIAPIEDPKVIEPHCSWWSFTCHEPFDYDEPGGGEKPRGIPPAPPKGVECSMLWTEGVYANGGSKKECA